MNIILLVSLLATAATALGVLAGCAEPISAPSPTLSSPTVTSPTASTPAQSPSPVQVLEVIPPAAAFALIKENRGNPNFIIIDVRTPAEYAEGHLEGAVLIDYKAADFNTNIALLDRNLTYLVYCRSGVRSSDASKIMGKFGFKHIEEIGGGINAWITAGLPVVK